MIVVVFSRDICLQVIMWGLRVNYRIGASIFIAGVDGDDHEDVDDGDSSDGASGQLSPTEG